MYDPVPPLEVSVCENGAPTVNAGNAPGETVIGEAEGVMVTLTRTRPKLAQEKKQPSSNSKKSLVAVSPLCV